MAYVPTSPDDEEAKRRAVAGTPPGSFGDSTPSSTPTHTNFVNVSDYLNKNPDASAKLGDLASSKLGQQRDEAMGAVNDASTGFGKQVMSGSFKPDPNFLSNAFSNPSTFVQNPDNLAKFSALKDATYKGPDTVQGSDVFAPAQQKVTALDQTGQGIGTESGRTQLVGGLSDHPTTGKSALNQLLLQGNSAAAQKISDTAGTFKNVDDQWQKFLTEAPNQVAQAKTDTDQARTATRAGLDDATSQFMKQLTDQTAKASQDRDAFNLNYSNIDKAISGGGLGLSQKQLDDLGISNAFPYLTKLNTLNQGLNSYGSPVQLSNYEANPGSPNTNVPTMASVASPDQYAREAALQQMAGHDLGLPDQSPAPYSANGRLPSLDYMGAFNKAGTDLQALDKAWQPKVAGYGPDDISMLYQIQARNATPGYYTDPTANATPTGGYGVTPPPAGFTGPVPYPAPTSNPPSSLLNPQWNPYTGKWEGTQLQPNSPPPSTGGGHVIY